MNPTPRRRAALSLALVVGLLGLVTGVGLTLGPPARAAENAPGNVFTGTVVDSTVVRLGDRGGSSTTSYDVAVDEVYVGRLRQEMVQVTTTRSFERCPVSPLPLDTPLILTSYAAGRTLVLQGCDSVVRDTDGNRQRAAALYGDPRPVIATSSSDDPQLEPVAFGTESADRPASFNRTAAPGLACVIVGLLGFVVVRRLGRRRA